MRAWHQDSTHSKQSVAERTNRCPSASPRPCSLRPSPPDVKGALRRYAPWTPSASGLQQHIRGAAPLRALLATQGLRVTLLFQVKRAAYAALTVAGH